MTMKFTYEPVLVMGFYHLEERGRQIENVFHELTEQLFGPYLSTT